MKATIPNQDPDCPDSTKDVTPVELDLGGEEGANGEAVPFGDAVAKAAAQGTRDLREADKKARLRHAKASAEERMKAVRDAVKAETGVSIGFDNLRAYFPKPKAAYGLWKRVVPLMVQSPDLLDLTVVKLVGWLAEREPNFIVTRDMMYDPLNAIAVKELERLLGRHGVKIKLEGKVSIASVRRQLLNLRRVQGAPSAEEFSLQCTVQGEIAHVNGKPYKIQKGASGRPRIKLGRTWLSLDTIRLFASAG